MSKAKETAEITKVADIDMTSPYMDMLVSPKSFFPVVQPYESQVLNQGLKIFQPIRSLVQIDSFLSTRKKERPYILMAESGPFALHL